MKGIIFDVDGTLWDSTREVAVAWNKVLQDEMEGHEILTAEGLQKEFGKPMDAIAESLFPEMPEKDRMELLGKMMAYENELVAVGPCVIYNGVPRNYIFIKRLILKDRSFGQRGCRTICSFRSERS